MYNPTNRHTEVFRGGVVSYQILRDLKLGVPYPSRGRLWALLIIGVHGRLIDGVWNNFTIPRYENNNNKTSTTTKITSIYKHFKCGYKQNGTAINNFEKFNLI